MGKGVVYLKYAYKSAVQRSRSEYKAVNVMCGRPFRLIDFEPDRRTNHFRYRADMARFEANFRSWGRWSYGKRKQRVFLSKFLGGGRKWLFGWNGQRVS